MGLAVFAVPVVSVMKESAAVRKGKSWVGHQVIRKKDLFKDAYDIN